MKGLVLSWFFPPATSAEGLVTFKLLKNSSFEYDVFSAESRLWSYHADTVLKSPNISAFPLKAENFKEWISNCAEQFAKRDSEEHYDFMMTRAMPPQSHTAGLLIKKKKPQLFWIASMADPIGHNPYDYDRYFNKNFTFLLKTLPKTIARLFIYLHNELFDRKICRKADMLIFPSVEQCRFTLQKRYEKYNGKILIIPHSYDMGLINSPLADDNNISDGPVIRDQKNGFTTVSHIGHLNPQRTAEGLIKAVSLLRQRDPALAAKLKIKLVGNLPEDQKKLLTELNLEDIIISEKPVDYFESVKLMKQSDCLLLIDAQFSFMKHNIFFASKLADYMGAKKPVIGLTDSEGPSGRILSSAGCPVCAPLDVEGIYRLLKETLQKGTLKFSEEIYLQYDARTVAKAFDEKVRQSLT